MEKKLYIEMYDRDGIFRCGIANGNKIPAGIIAGKGWTLKTCYHTFDDIVCPDCGDTLFEDNVRAPYCSTCKRFIV